MKRCELVERLKRLAYCEGMDVCDGCIFDMEVCRNEDTAQILREAADLLDAEGSPAGTGTQGIGDALSKRIASLRKDSGLSYRALRKAMEKYFYTDTSGSKHEVSIVSMNSYEMGNCARMSAEVLVWYADFFGVSVDWLLGRTDRRE